MRRIALLLIVPMLSFLSCNNSGESSVTAKDTVQENPTDSFNYNPAMPAAQNSDEPERFSP